MGADDRRTGVVDRAPAGLLRAGLVCASALLVAAVVLLVGWVLVRLAPVTLAIVAALLLAALLSPAVDALARLRLPRAAAALTMVLTLLGVLLGPVVLIGQQAAAEFDDLGDRLDEGVARVRDWIVDGPLPVSDRQLDQMWQQARESAVNALPGPAAGASVAAEAVGATALALVLVFFLLKDGDRMWDWVLRRAPRRHQDRVGAAGRAGWDALSGYVRGTVVIAAIDATGIGAALLLVGVPLALPLALLTFVSAFVPIIGATVAGAAAVLVALVAGGPTDALLILAAVIGVQQAEGNLLEPLVMGRAVRLHPAVILVAVAAGTVLGGVAGAIVAVPLVAVSYRVITSLAHGDRAADESDGPPRGAPPEPVGAGSHDGKTVVEDRPEPDPRGSARRAAGRPGS